MPYSFLRSKYFYTSLVIAFAGAEIDWVLTALGLVLGYNETRPFFWLHAVALFGLIIAIYAVSYEKRPRMTDYLCLVLAVLSPAIPIISNVMILTTGRSLFF